MSELTREMLEHPFFQRFNSEDLERLNGCASKKDYAAGTVMFREGETADRLFLIQSGRVAIVFELPSRDPLTILTIEAGGVVGWSWLFAPYKWHFQAKAVEPTQAIVVESKCLLELCESNPAFGYQLMRRTARTIFERLEGTTQQLASSFNVP